MNSVDHRFCVIIICFLGLACKEKSENPDLLQIDAYESNTFTVGVQCLKDSIFFKEIVANGVIEAVNKSDLSFKQANRITGIYVENGQTVKKGEVLAVLDNTLLSNELDRANIEYEKAKLKFLEEKINFGFNSADENGISEETINRLKIRSGLLEAENNIENAKIKYNQTFLVAPFDGLVANLDFKSGDYYSSDKSFCSLIDHDNFEIKFSVIESELSYIKKGQQIKIKPFHESFFCTGYVTQINPIIDDSGLIEIKAKLTKEKESFAIFHGMNAEVLVLQKLDGIIPIPKKAVVRRNDKSVVFTTDNKKAKWNYVQIEEENSTTYGILPVLKIGDTIIVTGNLNLSHDAKVNDLYIPE